MRKFISLTLVFAGALLLSGCDLLGDDSKSELWYDDQAEMLNLSYSIDEPSSDDGTTETEFLYLEAKHRDAQDWFVVIELNQYDADNLQIEYRFEDYGDIDLRVVAKNEAGDVLRSTEIFNIYINQPQYIYHINAYFDEWSGEVNFQFGINQQVVKKVRIDKSVDGGLSWSEVIFFDVILNEEDYYEDNFSYYETVEDTYVYRIVGFDSSNTEVATLNSWGETRVQFENKQFDGEPFINYVSANVDVYSQSVYLWWDAVGDFDVSLVEKSTDMINWDVIAEVPRVGQAFSYQESDDGEYYYRVSAINVDGDNISSAITENSLRVKLGAVIGSIDGWHDWENSEVNINWDIKSEGIAVIKIERKEMNDNEFTLLGEFGPLKTTHNDLLEQPGTYIYKVTVYNEEGEEIDFMESKEFYIEAPVYVYSLNAYYDYDQGYVSFYYGIDQYQVYKIMIEKSNDGGITWETVIEKELDVNNPGYIDDPRYLEFGEGQFTYRITGYNELDNEVGTSYSWEIVDINYEYLNLEQPTEVHYLDAQTNIYDASVNLWWSSQGIYYRHLVEKSTDGETWETIAYLPRVASSYYYFEETDGEYYYRVSAVGDDGVVIHSRDIEYSVRVKSDALLGSIDGWYDWNNSEITLNWDLLNEDVHIVRLERIESLDAEYTFIEDFGNVTKMFIDQVVISGTYTYKLSVLNDVGEVLDFIESKEFYIEAPQHIYHLNAYFNQGSGEVKFDFGFNEFRVVRFEILKSDDGGLIWVEEISRPVEFSADNYVIWDAKYNEFTEGTYVYKMIGYDEFDNLVGEVFSWNEVSVKYDNLNEDEPTEIYYVDTNVNIYNDEVSIWWGAQGPYESHKIEKSTDLVNWELVDVVFRVVTSYYYTEDTDGEYYYRVSALDSNNDVVDSKETEYSIRVKEDAQIGHFNIWFDYFNQEVNVNWDILNDNVAIIRVERKLVEDVDYDLIGNYGPLKRLLYDSGLSIGDYVYKLTLLDESGNILDELESNVISFELYVN